MHNIRLRENAVAQLEAFGNATFALNYPSLSLCVYSVLESLEDNAARE